MSVRSRARRNRLIEDDEQNYDVSRDENGMVVLHLGLAPPFAVPPVSAFKFAALMLKAAGFTVELSDKDASLTARLTEREPAMNVMPASLN